MDAITVGDDGTVYAPNMATHRRASKGDSLAAVSREVRRLGVFGDETHPRFMEYIARDHLETGIPIVELHRGLDLPLAAVRRWIAIYRADGRAGLEAHATTLRAREAAREAKAERSAARSSDDDEVAALAREIASGKIERMRAAYATIKKRRLHALVPALVERVRRVHDRKIDMSVADELELLAHLKAAPELHALRTAKLRPLRGLEGWWLGLFKAAGCPTKVVNRPYAESYQLAGTWHRIR